MQRFLLTGLLVAVGTICAAAPKKPSIHEQIASYSAAIGANLLAQDLEDEHGKLLLRFARTLQPEDDAVLLAMAQLERGKSPDPIKTKVTEAKLYKVIAKQAESLRQEEWPKNAKAGQLALLYYRMAERFRPTDEKIMLALMRLRVRGVTGDLEQALAETSDLKDVFGNPEEPEPPPEHELEEIDRNIAKYAAIWASNRLAIELNDGNGLVLLQLAGCVDPENETALLTTALLEREKSPALMKSDETEEKLVKVIIRRAGKLLASATEKNKNAGQFSLLYFKVGERFQPDNEKVLRGLMKLKGKGIEGELDELLGQGPYRATPTPPPRPAQVKMLFGEWEPLVAAPSKEAGKWARAPDEFKGYRIASKGKNRSGVADFEVTGSGHLYVACNYAYQGNSGGGWQKERWAQKDFIDHGWQLVPDLELIAWNKRSHVIFSKYCKAGEKYRLRCNKYEPPYVILRQRDQGKHK